MPARSWELREAKAGARKSSRNPGAGILTAASRRVAPLREEAGCDRRKSVTLGRVTTWKLRESKRQWARNNPDKVSESNGRWRAAHVDKVRRQAKERMRRYRQRLAKIAKARTALAKH